MRLRHVGWRVGSTPVIEDVSIDVAPGEFVALLGRNGAGKSTLLDIAAGLREPAEGHVEFDGRPLHSWTPAERARHVAHLPQTTRADLAVRADAVVLMGRYPHSSHWFESEEDRAIADDAMQRCGCRGLEHRTVGTLSGGERQRVLLAACLAQRAAVLLLDEPAAHLDVDHQLACFEVLRDEAARGTACVVVTHDVNFALRFCSRIVVLAQHTVVCDRPIAEALEVHDWLTAFSSGLVVEKGADGRAWVRYA
jgi:iron complex transport system ATP-binding protein